MQIALSYIEPFFMPFYSRKIIFLSPRSVAIHYDCYMLWKKIAHFSYLLNILNKMILIFENKKRSSITNKEIGYIAKVKRNKGIFLIDLVLLILLVRKINPLKYLDMIFIIILHSLLLLLDRVLLPYRQDRFQKIFQ